jgi:DNA-binding NtrC family response regulator
MTGSVLVVHPEADQLDRIQTLLQPLALEIRRASGYVGAIDVLRSCTVDLVVGTDILDIPEHDPRVVEGIRRITSHLPVVVLIRDRSQMECPRATLLLTGLQQYLVWPKEAADLPAVARALLRTSRYLNGSHQDQLTAMRSERDARRMRETLNALRATGGNVSQAAEVLKMSRSGLNYRLKQLGLR